MLTISDDLLQTGPAPVIFKERAAMGKSGHEFPKLVQPKGLVMGVHLAKFPRLSTAPEHPLLEPCVQYAHIIDV